MLSNINQTQYVEKQYSGDKNLSARQSLHSKYSTNKQGFGNWLWEHYAFCEDFQILELGCGNGAQWENRINSLPIGCMVTLSDLSNGMVDIVRSKFATQTDRATFAFRQIDIQDIPFPDETFDAVIANHMLYHVPDLCKALSEVSRVLKEGGRFYCSTNGNGGLIAFLREAIFNVYQNTELFKGQITFTLQNGLELLNGHFSNVIKFDYEDSLAITDTQDLIDYLESSISMSELRERGIDSLYNYFESIRKARGTINIPKEAGLFISSK